LVLTDLTGRTFLNKTINTEGTIDGSHLTAGVYYLKNINTGAIKKLVITK
jgi:hypothetical protein